MLYLILALLGIFYVTTTVRIAITAEPFIDEGWIACPAYNLAFHGFTGTTCLEPTGSIIPVDLKGIREVTYWNVPMNMVTQAAWYRLVGFGLFQMRLLSVVWGAVALVALFFIVRHFSRSLIASTVAVVMLVFDFTFLWLAADGRMDMMCIALGLSAIAAYLHWREGKFHRALMASNCLMACCLFTHPNGGIFFFFLAALVVAYDRKRLCKRNLLALMPYAVLTLAWLAYIAPHPDYFLAQFLGNASNPTSHRAAGLHHPLAAVQHEMLRYFEHFGMFPVWTAPTPRFALAIPALYWAGCVLAWTSYFSTRKKAILVALAALAACVFLMTFGEGLKAHNYLGYVMPFYAFVWGVWACYSVPKARLPLAPLFIVALIVVQMLVLQQKLALNVYGDFRQVAAFLKTRPQNSINGTSALGFELGFDRITDDARLGEYSGKTPDLIVVDRWYRFDWQYFFNLATRQRIEQLLRNEYHVVLKQGQYTVFARNGLSLSKPPPCDRFCLVVKNHLR